MWAALVLCRTGLRCQSAPKRADHGRRRINLEHRHRAVAPPPMRDRVRTFIRNAKDSSPWRIAHPVCIHHGPRVSALAQGVLTY